MPLVTLLFLHAPALHQSCDDDGDGDGDGSQLELNYHELYHETECVENVQTHEVTRLT